MHLLWFLDCTTDLDYDIQIAAFLYQKEIEDTQSQEFLKLYINAQIQQTLKHLSGTHLGLTAHSRRANYKMYTAKIK